MWVSHFPLKSLKQIFLQAKVLSNSQPKEQQQCTTNKKMKFTKQTETTTYFSQLTHSHSCMLCTHYLNNSAISTYTTELHYITNLANYNDLDRKKVIF